MVQLLLVCTYKGGDRGMGGTVFALSTSVHGGVPKYENPCARIERYGFAGDYHNREMRPSFSRPGTMKPNDRQVSLVAREVLVDLNEQLGIFLEPGAVGENITTEGLGDLSDLLEGVRLRVGFTVVLRVTEQNAPCQKLLPLHRLMAKRIHGKRGLLCVIEEGFGSYLFAGDPIEILPAA